MKRVFHPLLQLCERSVLTAALAQLNPTHPAVPEIVRRLHDDSAPTPLDPADSIVTGACLLAGVFLIVMVALGALPGGA
jgi:hypothetical protein